MIFIKKLNELLFRAVAFLFSAVLLVLSLLNSISLAAAGEAAAGLAEERKKLEEENCFLRTELECRFSLSEIEHYAQEVLGMKQCSPSQIVYMDDIG